MTIRTRLAASGAAVLALALALVPAAAAHAVPLPTGSVAGVVRDGGGAPVENASIELESGSHFFDTTSSATGAFSFAGIPAGEYLVHSDSVGPTRQFVGEVVVPRGGTASLDPVLGLPSTVHGTVTGPGGVALEGIVVSVSSTDGGGGESNGPAGTPADGSFSLQVAPGEYTVKFIPPPGSDLEYQWFDGAHGVGSADKIQAPLGGDTFERNVQLQQNTTQITGEVWLHGAPQPGAAVVLQNSDGDEIVTIGTQSAGFSTAGVPAGTYSVFARFTSGGEDYLSQTETVVVGSGDVTIPNLVLVDATEELDIDGVPDAYQASKDAVLTVSASSGVLANDSITPASPLFSVLVAEPAHGEIFLQLDGAFSYAPEDGFVGTDTFTYSPGPTAGFYESVTVTIEVLATTTAGEDVLPATGGTLPTGPLALGALTIAAGLAMAVAVRGRPAER